MNAQRPIFICGPLAYNGHIQEIAAKRGGYLQHYLHHLVDHFGYIGIMIALMLGIVGLPIPDELLLTYAGYRVSTGSFSYPLAFLFCWLGAVIGISLSYTLGIAFGLPFLHRFGPKLHVTEKRLEQTKALFVKLGQLSCSFAISSPAFGISPLFGPGRTPTNGESLPYLPTAEPWCGWRFF